MRNAHNEESIASVLYRYLEHGISVKLFDCMNSQTMISARKSFTIIEQLDDLLEDNFTNLIVANFYTLFVGYFSICFLILFIYLLSYAYHIIVFHLNEL